MQLDLALSSSLLQPKTPRRNTMDRICSPLNLDACARSLAVNVLRAVVAAWFLLPFAPENLVGGELEDALARPASSGSIAMLARFARDPRATERLDKSLADRRADVRGAAARVAHVGFVRGLQGSIERALDEETDADAAGEEIRAIAALSGGKAEERILRARKRFNGNLDALVAHALARTLGPEALDRIVANVEPFRGDFNYRRSLVAEAARGQKPPLENLARRSLEERNELAWLLLLACAEEMELDLDRELLWSAVAPPYAGIASSAAWTLAKCYAYNRAPNAERLLSSLPRMDHSDPDTAFAFEMLRRSLGSAASDRSAWMRSVRFGTSPRLDDLDAKNAALRLLTAQELEALKGRATKAGIETSGETDWTPGARRPLTRRESSPTVRTAGDLPRGTGHALLAESGCAKLGGRLVGAAEVTYGPDGRPTRVTPIKGHGPKRCEPAAIDIFLLSLAPTENFPILDKPDIVLALSDESCSGSMDEEPVVGEKSSRKAGESDRAFEPPVLEKHVKPTYPAHLGALGVQGTVLLEAEISSDGCVKNVRTIETVHPGLDLESVRAAAQNRYRPARIGGGSIPWRVRFRVYYRKTGT